MMQSKRYTIEFVKQFAEQKGGKCLSKEYINAKVKLLWQCKCGYQWNANFDNVKNGKTWCPKCNDRTHIDITMVKEHIKSKGGECLSNEYVNERNLMKFQCENGHQWETSFRTIYRNNTWCPKCVKINNKSQIKLYNVIREIFPNFDIEFNYKGFDWLKTSKFGCQEIDIFVNDIKLAIEYDGEQHFKPMRFGSKKDMLHKLKIIQDRDQIKNEKITQHKEDVKYFVRIPYTEKINKDNVMRILKNNNVSI